MADTIVKQAVYDSRILPTSKAMAVRQGPSQVSQFFQQASTATTSSVIISCQFPSLSVVMDRYVTLQGGIYLRFVATPAAIVADEPVCYPGTQFALAPLPLQRLCSSQTVTINGQSTTFQTSQLIDVVTRMLASKRTSAHSASPIRSDFYALASTGSGGSLNPYCAVNDSYDEFELGSASWPFTFTDPAGNALQGAGNYVVNGINFPFVGGTPVQVAGQAAYPIFIRYDIPAEPVIVSPFAFGPSSDIMTEGMHGINQVMMNFQLRSAQDARILRQLDTDVAIGELALFNVGNSPFVSYGALFQHLTPPPSIPVMPTCTVPYEEIQAYTSQQAQNIAAGATVSITTPSIVLPSIPDYLLICVKPSVYPDLRYGDVFLSPQKLTLNFENSQGQLAAQVPASLWRMTQNAGLKSHWLLFSGRAWSTVGGLVATAGSPIALTMGQDVTFASQSYAPGVAGSFSVSAQITVNNQLAVAVQQPIVQLIAISSGVWINQGGQSSKSTAILSEPDVLAAISGSAPVGTSTLEHMLGAGSMWDKLSSAATKGLDLYQKSGPALSATKQLLASSGNDKAKQAADIMSKLGLGHVTGAGAGGKRRRLEERFD